MGYAKTAAEREAGRRVIVRAQRQHPEWGPSTPARVRRYASHELYAAGCSLSQIGGLFGVSFQAIRLDLASSPDVTGRLRMVSQGEEAIINAIRRLDGGQDGPSARKVMALLQRTLANRKAKEASTDAASPLCA